MDFDNKIKNIEFHALISIGDACRTRYQLDSLMLSRFPDYKTSSYCFDYLMMGGLPGVINLLQRDFLMTEDDICIFDNGGKFAAQDKNSGMVFLHDFGASHWWDSYDHCEAAIRSTMHSTLDKYQYLGSKTKALLMQDSTFGLVYYGSAKKNDFERLKEVVEANYSKNFYLIHVTEAGTQNLQNYDDLVLSVTVNDSNSPKIGTPREWEGWDESWQKAFLKFVINPTRIS